MADQYPLKALYDGSTVTGLGQFAAGDTVPIANGGTGATSDSGARTALGLANAVIGNGSITSIVALTQAEYNAIGSPSATTLYIITDA